MTKAPGAASVAAIVVLLGCAASHPVPASVPGTTPMPVKHGRLQVKGTQLCDDHGRPVQLRGMSTMGLQWAGGIVNDAAFAALAKDWKADVVRLAMYIGEDGYQRHPELKDTVWKGVDLAIKYGLYAIIDWQLLTPGSPNDPVYAGAQAFFDEASKRYGRTPNVLYEIMSEPNGNVVWARDLKPYAEKIVATIRANDPDNIILIGSSTWSQDVDIAAADPVSGRNLMYSFHFYAGSHGDALRAKVKAAIGDGAAVFASEWGTTDAIAKLGPFFPQSETWLAFLDRYNISWVNWALCDGNGPSGAILGLADALKQGKTTLIDRDSLLVPQTMGPDGYPIWPDDELSPSGRWVRARIRNRGKAEHAGANLAR